MQKVIFLTYFIPLLMVNKALAVDSELESRIRIIVRNQIEAKLYEISQDKKQVCSIGTFANYFDKELSLANATFAYWQQSFELFSPAKIEIFKLQIKKQCCLMTGKTLNQ
jgi:hypothetical protein